MKKILLCAAMLAITLGSVRAQPIPTIVSYQGYLTHGGTPYDGTVPVILTLYNAQSGGSQVWSHTYSNPPIQVSKGYYSVLMDFSQDWQNGSADFHGQYWLEVNVNGETMGRVQMTGSPFAINSIHADTASVALSLVQDAPIGTIVAYAGQALGLPQEQQIGWYVCNGDSIPVATYQAYATAIGSIYGTSADGNYVYIPDLRGMFLRGVNGNRSDMFTDSDASTRIALNGRGLAGNQVGSVQLDAMHQHFHYINERNSNQGPTDAQFTLSGGGGGWFADPPNQPNSAYTANGYMGGTGYAEGGNMTSENRPKNAYVFWLIKVK